MARLSSVVLQELHPVASRWAPGGVIHAKGVQQLKQVRLGFALDNRKCTVQKLSKRVCQVPRFFFRGKDYELCCTIVKAVPVWNKQSRPTSASSSMESMGVSTVAGGKPKLLHGNGMKVVTPMVKMCGITSAEDAAIAARAGASFVGMIVWPRSKRSVSVSLARDIAAAVRENGAEPVGVFVDENAAEIESVCDSAGLTIAQLHGDGARASLLNGLLGSLKIIYVLHANKNGIIQTSLPNEKDGPLVDWVLVDSLQGGSGEKFDWTDFQVPIMGRKRGWLLAGGLTPDNVATALSLIKPDVVDVSSGIAGPDGIRKDPARIEAFIQAVRSKSLN